MAKIKQILPREILDAKGNPTIEVTVILTDNAIGTAACPSGTSVGSYEAVDLRDHDPKRYHGLGVLRAIENIQTIIAPALIGRDANDIRDSDKTLIELDGTPNKSRLGANATLSVSMAVCKAAAKSSVLPPFLFIRQFINKEGTVLRIPTPLFNIINGGLHAGNNLNFQEYLVIPASAKGFSECLQIGTTIYAALRNTLQKQGFPTLVGDEGGFAPNLPTNVEGLAMMKQAVDATSYRFGFDVFFGLDVAAGSFFDRSTYRIKDKSMNLSAADMGLYYEELNKTYHLLYLEDPFAEDDWDGWTSIAAKLGKDTIITGDDLTATNPYRLQLALNKKAITGIIIKPNQIGTVLESLAVVEVARQAGLKITVSHRSGETTDDFIADFAVAVAADYVKFGAPARGERVVKYNRLLHIENQMKSLTTL